MKALCRLLGHDLFGSHCTRCGYDRPFSVGRLYDAASKPGPYPSGEVPLADLRRLVAATTQRDLHASDATASAPNQSGDTPRRSS